MGDDFPGDIQIGGKLPESLLVELVVAICQDGPGLGLNYDEDGQDDDEYMRHIIEQAGANKPLEFSNSQASMGQFENIESFCVDHDLLFLRHSDAKNEYDAEWVWSTLGNIDLDTVHSNADNDVLIDAADLTKILSSPVKNDRQKLEEIAKLVKDLTPPEVPLLKSRRRCEVPPHSHPPKGTKYEIKNPNPDIKEVTRNWQSADGRVTPICELHVNHLGNIMRMMRDSAMVIRMLKIAEMVHAKMPRGKRKQEERENDFARLTASTWRNFLPSMFSDMERDCRRRGLVWNELTAEQEAQHSITLSKEMAKTFMRGKAALAKDSGGRASRVHRSISL